MDKQHFVYPFPHGHLSCFYDLSIMNDSSVDIHMDVSV